MKEDGIDSKQLDLLFNKIDFEISRLYNWHIFHASLLTVTNCCLLYILFRWF